MHHTLLPAEERQSLRREYFIRFSMVICLMISIVSIIGALSLVPAYLRANSAENEQIGIIAEMKRDKDARGTLAIENELKTNSAMVDISAKAFSVKHPSEEIEKIVALRENVRLTSISYESLSTTTVKLLVQGIAPTRSSLLSFKDRLVDMAVDTTVDLPISELEKSSNIPFSLKITHPLP